MLQATIDSLLVIHAAEDLCLVTADKEIADSISKNIALLLAPHASQGLGGSLRDVFTSLCLNETCWEEVTAVGIYLADMPAIRPDTIAALRDQAVADKIVRPVFEGVPGHPVWIGKAFWEKFLSLTGDEGGKPVLKTLQSDTIFVPVNDAGVVLDIDTPEIEAVAKLLRLMIRR